MPKNITSVPGFNFEKEVLAIKEIKNSSKKKVSNYRRIQGINKN
jgi:hypothetical protein